MRTGDGGYLDSEGFLYVCDRTKDMIICAGENIYHLADFKVPKTVKVVAQLPRNASGKILEGEAPRAFWAGRVRNVN